jgi:hypothetical protein
MTQTLTRQAENLQNMSMVAWRIRRDRAQTRETQVHQQLMRRLHDDKPLN